MTGVCAARRRPLPGRVMAVPISKVFTRCSSQAPRIRVAEECVRTFRRERSL